MGRLIFISGGVRSGKSSFAEQFAVNVASSQGGKLHYIATGVPCDKEMEDRIIRHKFSRSSYGWQTWEEHMDPGKLAGNFTKRDVILIDCLTNWVNNLLFNGGKHSILQMKEGILKDVFKLRMCCHTLIIVSNDVSFDTLFENKLVFSFKHLLGKVHQDLVRVTDQAFLVEACTPVQIKCLEAGRWK
ncbi:bifunctional adenosylcobinamide kinase/adenosylcobinamide-phosphate guanylyltransferase [Pseudalkalibacillus sp. SCS-8]|uniref:bifunctional adenosylcobinamide kinase/adenosylcobinamide-phosphate guanylyltransferase n=1 Tax=Pseudalkalibacillus nanhaiensis TaxID=3115291 RepID=UPI0032D9D39D